MLISGRISDWVHSPGLQKLTNQPTSQPTKKLNSGFKWNIYLYIVRAKISVS